MVTNNSGTKSEVAASPLPSRGPKRGRKCKFPLSFSGIPNAKRGEQNQKWSPIKGNQIRSGYLTPAFKRAEMPQHPCILGDLQRQARGAKSEVVPNRSGTKSEVAASPLPSWGPKRRRKCHVTPAFSGIPNAKRGQQNQKWSPIEAEQNQKWLPHPCLLGGPKDGGNATSPLHSHII